MSRHLPLKRFYGCARGNFAVGAALLIPLLLGAAGGAVDLFVHNNHRGELQDTADAAVLAAATEAGLKGWSAETASSVVAAVVSANLKNRFSGVTFEHSVTVDEARRRITLELTQDHYGYFYLGYFTGSPQIKVEAIAAASGQSDICVIVRSPSAANAFMLDGDASVTAAKCSAYSNSKHTKGVAAAGASKLTTELSCSGGGYSGGSKNFKPLPVRDCPQISDPLAQRTATIAASISTATCSFTKTEIKGTKKSLFPGTYCGGLKITGGATASLAPGIYVIKDGKLRVEKKSTIEGTEVSFVFIGEKAGLELKNDATVSLTAPDDGPLAGILIHAPDGGGSKSRVFKIESRNARRFTGTIHTPSDRLVVGGDKDADGVCDADGEDNEDDDDDDDDEDDEDDEDDGSEGTECESEVGSSSAWTAIIARELLVTNGVNLVINADYDATTIPVPEGLGPTSSRVFLAK